MKKINIEETLKRAINDAPLLNFEDLVSMPYVKMTEHDYITRQPEKRSFTKWKQFSLAGSLCVVLLICISNWFFQYRMFDTVITLDVNPSIEIVTNRQDKILKVNALNEDAQIIIDGQDYKNTDLNKTIDAILAALIRQGYLDVNKNTILVSVENKSSKKADDIRVSLDKTISDSLSSQNISPQVLSQVITKDKDISDLAMQYSVSEGKIKLILEIISLNNTLSMKMLAPMSMEDLLSIAKKYEIDLHSIIQYEENYTDNDIGDIKKIDEDEGRPDQDGYNNSKDYEDDNVSQSKDNINNGEDQLKPDDDEHSGFEKTDDKNDDNNKNNDNNKNDENSKNDVNDRNDENDKNIENDKINENDKKNQYAEHDGNVSDNEVTDDKENSQSDNDDGNLDNKNTQLDYKNEVLEHKLNQPENKDVDVINDKDLNVGGYDESNNSNDETTQLFEGIETIDEGEDAGVSKSYNDEIDEDVKDTSFYFNDVSN